MNTQQHIDQLFSNYQESPALTDFKEELKTNLDDRIQSLMKKAWMKNLLLKKQYQN